jgi:chemotaxis protein MotB
MTKSILFVLLLAIVGSGCVTKKKYDDLSFRKDHLEKEYQALLKVRDEKRDLERQLQATEIALEEANKAGQQQKEYAISLEKDRDQINERIDELIRQNQALLSASANEKQSLVEEILAKEEQLRRKETAQDSLARALSDRERQSASLAASLAEKEARINELDQLVRERENALKSLRDGLLNALKGFTAADLTVREENGRIYVSLSQNLLFAVGSDKLAPKGVEALKQLGGVLKDQEDLQILVEGHTDTDGSSDLNWDLSLSRAATVVKLLTKEGLDPTTVTAAGRGFYLPVASNDTAEGKSANRRVEIILVPRLEKIMELIGRNE